MRVIIANKCNTSAIRQNSMSDRINVTATDLFIFYNDAICRKTSCVVHHAIYSTVEMCLMN